MKKVLLAPYVSVGFLNGVLHFGFGSLKQLIGDKEVQNCVLDAAVYLKTPRLMGGVSSYLAELGHTTKSIEQVLDILSKKFLIRADCYDPKERHSRSLLFYSLSGAAVDEVQNAISSKTIAVVGCGGIGNVVSVLLATAGVEKFILVDADRIELSNLSRQVMFKEIDCGEYKTEVLAKALKQRSSCVQTIQINEFIDKNNLQYLDDADFILISGDQANVMDLINVYAIQSEIPFINVGYVEDVAVWGPLVVPGKSGCYQCRQHFVNFDNLTQEQINKCNVINSGYQAPSNGPINMMSSSFAALDILKFLGNFGEIQSLNTKLGVWSHDLHIEKLDYSINPLCEICGPLQKKIE